MGKKRTSKQHSADDAKYRTSRVEASSTPATPLPLLRRPRTVAVALITAAVALFAAALVNNCVPPPRFNVVLISVDTLRADHVGAYGYHRPTTPSIDALARDGIIFEQAICQNTNTNPSHASILSGYYPRFHGSWDNFYLMGEEIPLVQEAFLRARAPTAAFVSGYTLKDKICGLSRGFEVYDDEFTGKERRGDLTMDRALDWLHQQDDERFFLFVHLFDPHGPYNPPPELAAAFPPEEPSQVVAAERIPRYQRLPTGVPVGEAWTDLQVYKARYDAEVAFADRQVGRLLDALDALGLADDTVVVLTSDHGEAFDERAHLLDHGAGIGDEEIRVPLILRLPGRRLAGMTFPGQVQSIDITPTLAAAAGLEYPHPTQGKNLLPLAAMKGPSAHEYALTETRMVPVRWPDRGYDLQPGETLKAVRSPRWKLVVFPGRRRDYRELYDLEADPGERRDIARQQPEATIMLENRLDGFLTMPTHTNQTANPNTDADTRDIFCTLGYLDCAD